VLLDRGHQRTDGLRGTLHDLFDRGDALEQMLVEREVFLFLVVVEVVFFE
jgi:hypothetical protein